MTAETREELIAQAHFLLDNAVDMSEEEWDDAQEKLELLESGDLISADFRAVYREVHDLALGLT